MHRPGRYVAPACLLVGLLSVPALGAESELVVPLRLHIVSGVEMAKRGVPLTSWVTARDAAARL